MKAILKCESPKSCQLIANGKKTILLSKTRPKLKTPFKGYIYCTKENYKKNRLQKVNDTGDIFFDSDLFCFYLYDEIEFLNGKVIGEFVCDEMDTYLYGAITKNEYWINGRELEQTCMNYDELLAYGNGKTLYGLHISELKIYDKPKELGEFYKFGYTNDHDAYKCAAAEVPIGFDIYSYKISRPPQSWCYVEEYEE